MSGLGLDIGLGLGLHSCQHLKMGKSNDFRANRGLWPIYIFQ